MSEALDPLPRWTVTIRRLDQALAELHVSFAGLAENLEVRGRLMGPRCPGVSTVEVAYHLRPLGPLPTSTYRVLIPDPSHWSEARPFVYEGPLEFVRDGVVQGRATISIGLRQPGAAPRSE